VIDGEHQAERDDGDERVDPRRELQNRQDRRANARASGESVDRRG
jgi:hypothetical protein